VVLIVVLPAVVLGLPMLLATSSESGRIARLDGIAEWTRNLSGVLTAGQGLEQALMASLRSTPESVRPQVSLLVARLRSRWPTEQALRAFADDLGDATGDLVAAALILGARKRGPGLAAVLTGLAESTADDVRARRQIEADRAKPRATARWVTILSAGALGVLALSGQFLAPYATPVGQAVLLVLLACYAASLAWLRHMAATPPPARFITSRTGVAQ
jgi:Flp pilus assembly protein TadB